MIRSTEHQPHVANARLLNKVAQLSKLLPNFVQFPNGWGDKIRSDRRVSPFWLQKLPKRRPSQPGQYARIIVREAGRRRTPARRLDAQKCSVACCSCRITGSHSEPPAQCVREDVEAGPAEATVYAPSGLGIEIRNDAPDAVQLF